MSNYNKEVQTGLPRLGPGATPTATPVMAQAVAAAEAGNTNTIAVNKEAQVADALKGQVSHAPPTTRLLDPAQIEALRQSIRNELREEFLAVDPSREQAEEISTPFNNFQLKLAVYAANPQDPIPGFHLRFVNDEGDRLMQHQMMGYALVNRNEIALDERVTPLNKDLGDHISVYVGSTAHGSPMRSFLMKIPNERYEARMKQAQRHNDNIDNAIRRGTIGNPGSKSYIPKDTPIVYEPQRGVLQRLPKTS